MLLDWLSLGHLLLSLFLSGLQRLWRFNMDLGVSLLPAPLSLRTAALRRVAFGDLMSSIYPHPVLHTDSTAIEADIADLRRPSTPETMACPGVRMSASLLPLVTAY
ncbi:hypothetical protein SPRG_14666 [Saprolegnia parasitica CBS 223.65]|uniref:Secreted protein n=1 Tax=Saprolegnia parasitica (strain CBS 223.65) TaxID=695850 RepID=A0A067BMN1_SAPPC|nr:hypothetical protein SPRG_14666 [Saprolegnia parasitica CBS 223.65]KDO19483.1 hypothetical protein SPRG_14666 [Saprolegnia parasitica CBS 223.65]|eukprot:XP_012209826.1 hypothetical protein SPRG_14666 [Saprolegnia parasitica CBS 223.65]